MREVAVTHVVFFDTNSFYTTKLEDYSHKGHRCHDTMDTMMELL